ncbi:MAG: ankyrin repeat domain-containing protein [Parashewanella sp.]
MFFPFNKLKSNSLILGAALIFVVQSAHAEKNGLFSAIDKNDASLVTQTLRDKVDINAVNQNGDSPLLAAARIGNLKVMDTLLKYGANINQLDPKKRDILNIAISNRNPELARWALDNNIDPTMVTSIYQGSALIYACHQGQVEIVDMLIKAGAPLNRVNNIGWTALLETTVLGDGSKKYQDITRLLVKAGADISIKDRKGKTPLDHANARDHKEIVKILQNKIK